MKRLLYLVTAWILLLLPAAGCGVSAGTSGNPDIGEPNEFTDGGQNLSGELEIWLLKDGRSLRQEDEVKYLYDEYKDLSYMVSDYRDARPNMTLRITEFDDTQQYQEKLLEEISSGGGPDVIFFTHGKFDEPYAELAEAGLLRDLNPLLQSDSSPSPLVISDFVQPLVELYEVDGNRTALPLDMKLDLFVTTLESMQASGLPLPKDGLEAGALLDMELAFARAVNAGPETVFMRMAEPNELVFALRSADILPSRQRPSYFDSNTFKSLLSKYLTLEQQYPDRMKISDSQTSLWKLDKFLFTCVNNSGLMIYETLFAQCHKTPVVAASVRGGGVTAVAHNYIAMNQNTGDPEAAYDFIRFMLQNGLYNYSCPSQKTVYANNLKDIETRLIQNTSSFDYATGQYKKPAEDLFFSALYEIPERITSVYVEDKNISGMVFTMLRDIKENGTPAGEAADELQQRVLEYYSTK